MTTPQPKPSALLLMSPQCSHCPSVMDGLIKLLKDGKLGRVEMVNLFEHPEIAQQLNVRSVPWTRIGPFEIEGAASYGELKQWAEDAADEGGMTRYYSHLLTSQQLQKVIDLIKQNPSTLLDLIILAGDLETPMAARIGVGAVLEDLAGTKLINDIVPELTRLTQSAEQQIRADACHYLSLAHSQAALDAIALLKNDPDPEVREIAMESAATLEAVLHKPFQE